MEKIFLGLLFILLSQSLQARYYDPDMGRFASRDPLQYIDGMNLYAGYFAQSFQMDPMGTVKLNISPRDPGHTPWNWTNGLNKTVTIADGKITHECISCCEIPYRDEGKSKVEFTVNLKLNILISRDDINRRPQDTLRGLYGHEVKHVINIINEVKRVAKELEAFEKRTECKLESEDCDIYAETEIIAATAAIKAFAESEVRHKHKDSPKNRTPYEPPYPYIPPEGTPEPTPYEPPFQLPSFD